MEHWLAISPWRHFVMILYISDYYLTIYSARGFRETGHFQFEDSLELTPQYQKDVNAFKPISKLHFTLLVLYSQSFDHFYLVVYPATSLFPLDLFALSWNVSATRGRNTSSTSPQHFVDSCDSQRCRRR